MAAGRGRARGAGPAADARRERPPTTRSAGWRRKAFRCTAAPRCANHGAARRGEDGRTVRRSLARGRHRDPGDRHPAEPRPAPGFGHRHRRGDPGERPDADELPARLRGRRRGPGPGAVRRRARRPSDPADRGRPRPRGRRQHGRARGALSGQPVDERGRHLRPPGCELRSLERRGGRDDDHRQSRRVHLPQATLFATTTCPAPSSWGAPTTWACSPTSA